MNAITRPALFTAVALLLAACYGPAGPLPTSSAPPPESSGPSHGTDAVVVTFRVGDRETFKVLLTDPVDVAIARDLATGAAAPSIPNGKIVRGSADVNEGYSWHLDPADIEFAEVTTEVCDGLPSYVEDGSLSGDRFCPWSAEVVSIEPAVP